jgi:hypothetical protein
MPTNVATGFERYIYDHKAYPSGNFEDRQYVGPKHDVLKLPPPSCDDDTAPLIMVEPCYASGSNDIWISFRKGGSLMLPRNLAEQFRDALILACEKPLNGTLSQE